MMPIIIEQTMHPITIITAIIIMTEINTMEFDVLVAGVLKVTVSVIAVLRDSILMVDLLGVVVEVHCKKKSVQCTPNMVCYVCPIWNTLYGVK